MKNIKVITSKYGVVSNYSWKSLMKEIFPKDVEIEVKSFNLRREYNQDNGTVHYGIFDGGYDVTPQLYGQDNKASGNNVVRDMYELFMFNVLWRIPDIQIIGVCRGSQFINVARGGTLFQDIKPAHNSIHNVTVDRGFTDHCPSVNKIMTVNSTHHQAVNKLGIGLRETLRHIKHNTIEGFQSMKMIYNPISKQYVPQIKAVQSHPEYLDNGYSQSISVLKYLFGL
jgi:gamma-glutamyl-gamma-aminobutyrate hydrolase PuuD